MSKARFFSFDFESEKFGMGKGEEKTKKKTNPTKTNNAQEKSFDEFLIIHFREWGRKR